MVLETLQGNGSRGGTSEGRDVSQTKEVPEETTREVELPGVTAPTGVVDSVADLDLDTTFELVRNRRRRLTLSYLVESGGQVSVGELAEHVAAVENDTTVRAITSDQRKRAYVGLYQCHLPKLADAGVIEYDSDRGHAEAAPAAEGLLRYINGDDTDDRHQLPLYRGIAGAVAGLNVTGLVLSSVWPWVWTPLVALSLLVLVAVVGQTLLDTPD